MDFNSHEYVLPSANAEKLGLGADRVLNTWLAFQVISGHIALPILVATFLFSKSVKRHFTLINVCISWILSGISSCLLFYVGKERGAEPSEGLCIAQTSLLYGTTPMWAVSILMLVYHIWDCINPNMPATASKSAEAIKSTILFVAPYLTLTIFTISAAFLSILHPTRVNRDRLFFYCSLNYNPFSDAMLGFVVITCLAILAIKARLAVILYRNWRGIRHAGYASNIDVQLIFRVLVFGVYVSLGLIVSLLSIGNAMSAFPNMFAATIGIVISLLFGTQHDVLHAWFYWLPLRIHFEKKTIYFTRDWSPNFEIIKPSLDISKPLPAIPDKVLVIGRSNEHDLRLDSERTIQSIA